MRSFAVLACALGSVFSHDCNDDPPRESAPPILDWDGAAIPPPNPSSAGPIDAGADADADVPPLGGYDAGTCTGVATSCSLLTTALCSTAIGCSTVSKCTGYSTSCYSEYDSYSCSSQSGCYWSSYSSSCSGSSWSCNLFSGSSSCISQDGCRWQTQCDGIATSCSALSPAECAQQPGCSLR